MRIKIICIALLTCIITGRPVRVAAEQNRVPKDAAGIFQLVEKRNGRVTCRGVVIQLGGMKFKKRVRIDRILMNDRRGNDLRRLMTWCVERDGERLVIKFKPGMGDFGAGNSVAINIDRSEFVEPIDSHANYFTWAISTDVI